MVHELAKSIREYKKSMILTNVIKLRNGKLQVSTQYCVGAFFCIFMQKILDKKKRPLFHNPKVVVGGNFDYDYLYQKLFFTK